MEDKRGFCIYVIHITNVKKLRDFMLRYCNTNNISVLDNNIAFEKYPDSTTTTESGEWDQIKKSVDEFCNKHGFIHREGEGGNESLITFDRTNSGNVYLYRNELFIFLPCRYRRFRMINFKRYC